MVNSIQEYIDYKKLFEDLYNEQQDILIEERFQAKRFDDIIKFKEQGLKEFELQPEDCDYDFETSKVIFVFGSDLNNANESNLCSDFVLVTIEYDFLLDEFSLYEVDK